MKDPKLIIDTDLTQITAKYAQFKNISPDKAMVLFVDSKTYSTLINIETGLCYEMTDYIYDMFLEEMGEINEL